MGTVEKILDTLKKMNNDRKDQATNLYEEHSMWLRNEFMKVKELILYPSVDQNEKVMIKSEAEEISATTTVAVVTNTNESRSKRKSPEMSENSSRSSPLAKRSSIDIIIAAGLPGDLNKLKKEELLHELESRGNCTMTMRAKKQDLIDSLKALLYDLHYRQTVPVIAAPAVAPLAVESVAVVAVERKPSFGSSASPGGRKISILAEARNHVRASLLIESNESEDQRQQRLAKEYDARRNRSSQVRLSHVTPSTLTYDETRGRTVSVESNSSYSGQQNLEEEVVSSSDIHIDDEGEGEGEEEAQEEGHVEEEAHYDEEHEEVHEPDEQNDNWNEVPSPQPACKVDPETPAEPSSAVKAEPTHSSFKLSNLVGGTQLSFLTGGNSSSSNQSSIKSKEKDKAVVPALQQAQRLKEKEEAKAAQKKKELEEKKKEHMKKLQTTSASNPVNVSSSKLFQTAAKLTKSSTPSVVTAAPAAAPASVPAPVVASSAPTKKAFGWFRKDKDAIVTAPVTSTAAAAVPVVAGNTKGGKDRIFTIPTQPVAPPQRSEDVEELENDDQENHGRPFASATVNMTPSMVPVVPHTPSNILTENKTIATTTFTPMTPATPTQPPAHQSSTSKSNSYEPSPPPPNTSQQHVHTHHAVTTSNNSSPPQPQYQIDDREDSDASDTDGEEEQQSIPDWAKQPKLRQALERQYGLVAGVPAVDPDTIFPDVQSCVLEEIFGRNVGKGGSYAARTSSAKWDADELTLIEKRKYRRQMGYNVAL